MASYLTVTQFKLAGVIPPQLVDQLETAQAGWVDRQLQLNSSWVDAKLAKRYAVPFSDPAPDIVLSWVARLTTLACFLRRGVDPNDAQFQEIQESAVSAKAEIHEAAGAVHGLYELPLREDTTEQGISRGGPRYQSDQSPFAWRDRQVEAGRLEDDWR